MSTNEEKLQKLKVTELKELLGKNSLVQTGKKDDLIKRLIDNNVSLEDGGDTEELTDPADAPTTAEAYSAAPAAPPGDVPIESSAEHLSASAPAPAATEQPTLTPEQQAMKARAERFGVPFNPNPTSTPKSAAKPASTKAAPAKTETPTSKPAKAGAIDKAGLGIPDETLAKRAARFGLPEKKAEAPKSAAPVSASKPKSAAAELTPEQKAKQAEDEEKKRKRAEKFGTAAAPASNGSEPDAKKAKV